MGDRGYNAGGWAYMRRVWCPKCGFSFLTGNHDAAAYNTDTARPMRECRRASKCAERVARKKAKGK